MRKSLILLAVILLLAMLLGSLRWVPAGSVGFYQDDNRTVFVNGPAVVPLIMSYSQFAIMPLTVQEYRLTTEFETAGGIVQGMAFDVSVDYRIDPEKVISLPGADRVSSDFTDPLITRAVRNNLNDLVFSGKYCRDCVSDWPWNASAMMQADRQFEGWLTQNIGNELKPFGLEILMVKVDSTVKGLDSSYLLREKVEKQKNISKAGAII